MARIRFGFYPVLAVLILFASVGKAHDGDRAPMPKKREVLETAPAPRSADLKALVIALDSEDYLERESAEDTLRAFVPRKLSELRKFRSTLKLEAEAHTRLRRLIGAYDPQRYRGWEEMGQDAARVLHDSAAIKQHVDDMNQFLRAFGADDADKFEALGMEIRLLRAANLAAAQNKQPLDLKAIRRLKDAIEELRSLFIDVAKRAGMEAKHSEKDTFSLKVDGREYSVQNVEDGAIAIFHAPTINVAKGLLASKDKLAESLLTPDGKVITGKEGEATIFYVAAATPKSPAISLSVIVGDAGATDETMRSSARSWLKNAFSLPENELPEIKNSTPLYFRADTQKNIALPKAPPPRAKLPPLLEG